MTTGYFNTSVLLPPCRVEWSSSTGSRRMPHRRNEPASEWHATTTVASGGEMVADFGFTWSDNSPTDYFTHTSDSISNSDVFPEYNSMPSLWEATPSSNQTCTCLAVTGGSALLLIIPITSIAVTTSNPVFIDPTVEIRVKNNT